MNFLVLIIDEGVYPSKWSGNWTKNKMETERDQRERGESIGVSGFTKLTSINVYYFDIYEISSGLHS